MCNRTSNLPSLSGLSPRRGWLQAGGHIPHHDSDMYERLAVTHVALKGYHPTELPAHQY